MPFDYKIIVGAIAVALTLFSYIPYVLSIERGRTKPHAFSWFVWSVLSGSMFVLQTMEGGGAGAWSNGVLAVTCFGVFILALFRGERQIVGWDWVSLGAAGVTLGLWLMTDNVVLAVILFTATDLLGFAPTFRKTFSKPYEEQPWLYTFSAIEYTLSLVALESYTISTWLYPVVLVFANVSFIIMVRWRRRIMRQRQGH